MLVYMGHCERVSEYRDKMAESIHGKTSSFHDLVITLPTIKITSIIFCKEYSVHRFGMKLK